MCGDSGSRPGVVADGVVPSGDSGEAVDVVVGD